LKGFFHQGVMRLALGLLEDANCEHPDDFTSYVLGYHFTEGTAGSPSDPEGIYSVEFGFKVRMPNRKGRAVLQWLVDAGDVRSYVSCSSIEIVGDASAAQGKSSYTCNGHPLSLQLHDETPVLTEYFSHATSIQCLAASVLVDLKVFGKTALNSAMG
tara:strand:- start:2200 stop:2670 length:471 start_codon:yes stop_codon:yes gene_type:complete